MSRSTADRYLIILSDGESTVDDWKGLTDSLKTKGIRVIGLGVGTAQGSFIPEAGGGLVKDERGAVVMSRPPFLAALIFTAAVAMWAAGASASACGRSSCSRPLASLARRIRGRTQCRTSRQRQTAGRLL